MNDPFGARIRKYIPWPEYRALEASQAAISLIGRATIGVDEIKARQAILLQYEASLGFVYFGERKWLETRLNSNRDMPYSTWVANELEQNIFPGGFARETDSMLGSCWKGYKDDSELFWSSPDLSSPIALNYVEVLIREAEESSPRPEAGRVFEVLHDLAYYLHLAGHVRSYANSGEVGLDALVFWPQQSRWEMYLGNEYGSIGSVLFDDQEIVAYG